MSVAAARVLSPTQPAASAPALSKLATAAVFVLALACRTVATSRGGGFFGINAYDDSVYFSSALALVHGQLPYRDFLVLHPPGSFVALSPFATLGALTSEGLGFAAARLTWMLLGALNAVLVTRILRPAGRMAALAGGLVYALYVPAIRVERTTLLEGLSNTLLVLAMLLVQQARTASVEGAAGRRSFWLVGIAGALLGWATAVKIWGLVPLLIVAVWVWLAVSLRHAAVLLAGAAATAIAMCLPFFLAAPGAMWRMVVLDQFSRPSNGIGYLARLGSFAGLSTHSRHSTPAALAVGAALLLVVLWLAWQEASARLAVLLALGMGTLLLLTPSYFLQYPGSLAGPVAVTFGAAIGRAVSMARDRFAWIEIPAVVIVLVTALACAAPLLLSRVGERFPGPSLRAVTSPLAGCVTTDHPAVLIELNVAGRNIDRSCPVVLDLGGISYDVTRGMHASRTGNPIFQRYALEYLASGRATVVIRFGQNSGFSKATYTTITRWPVLHRSGRFVLRRPVSVLAR